MLVQIFFLKLINIERKTLAHPELIDRMAEQIESVIAQLCKESNLWVHPNLQQASLSLTFSFKFTYICIVDIWVLKRNFVKENKKPFTAIKTYNKT